jgi:hypothetical protein
MNIEDISSESLELRLKSTEHDFVERKSRTDKGGWLRTAVAFANSTPIGWPAVLFVGADDNGNPQLATNDLEDVIKAISGVLDDGAFPAIYRHIVPLHLSAGGSCLAVIIPGSPERPHFAGNSYIRVGSETKTASNMQFQDLIAQRSSKTRKILEYKGRMVTLRQVHRGGNNHPWWEHNECELIDCNQFFATLRAVVGGGLLAFPVEWIDISFDPNRDTLMLIVEQ